MSPEEGHNDDQRTGSPFLRRQARELGLFSLENIRLQGDLREVFQCFTRAYRKAGEGLFTRACGDKVGGNGLKL